MKYSTDKIEHKLIPEYEKLLAGYKDENIQILEIGIKRGGFLMWLTDFLPRAVVVGGDMVIPRNIDKILKYSSNIKFSQLNQNDSVSLIKMIDTYGSFDVIIDDASHMAMATKNTFETLWTFIKSNGLYIIEDFIAGYWPISRFKGMPDFIASIMLRKNELDISDYGIILTEPKCSYAYFRKK